MLTALWTVVATSLSGVMMPGPMFTVTLAKSLKSPWAGVMVSLGHAVVEVPLILLVYFGLVNFFQNEIVKIVLSVLGGAMIVWMGYDLFRARQKLAKEGKDTPYNAFVAGILMSGLNPFFLVWWVTVGSLLLMKFIGAVGTWGLPFFIIVHWLCDLVWLSVVSYAIYRTHKFWGERVQELVFVLLSAFLFYFGGMFVIKGVDDYLGINTWNWLRYIFWSSGFIFILYFLVRYLKSRDTEATSSSSRT